MKDFNTAPCAGTVAQNASIACFDNGHNRSNTGARGAPAVAEINEAAR